MAKIDDPPADHAVHCRDRNFHDPDARPEEWRVEEIDSDGDGGCDVVIFTGRHAEQRARRLYDRLQNHTGS